MSGRARAILIAILVVLGVGAAITIFVILDRRGEAPTLVGVPEPVAPTQLEPVEPEPDVDVVAPPVVQPPTADFYSPPPLPTVDATTRCSGNDPISLTIKCAQLMFPQPGTAPMLFIGRSDNTVDSFVATPWIGNVGGAYLATATASASSSVLAEVDRLLPDNSAEIIILGGTAAVSNNVISQLNGRGYGNVRRVFGQNRYETATKIADEIINIAPSSIRSFGFTEGQFLVDAYGYGPAAAGTAPNTGLQYILINPRGSNTIHPTTFAYIQQHAGPTGLVAANIVGGTSAVPADIDRILRDTIGLPVVQRISDVDRYWTNFRTIARFYTQPTRAITANGDTTAGPNQAYSLMNGGVYAALAGEPLLLVRPNTIQEGQRIFMCSFSPGILEGVITGNTADVSPAVENAVLQMISGTHPDC